MTNFVREWNKENGYCESTGAPIRRDEMKLTKESFQEELDNCIDALDIDGICFMWLRLAARENDSKTGIAIRHMLDAIEELME